MAITLRDVTDADLPIFFDLQRDPSYNHMAAFTHEDPDDRAAFGAWRTLKPGGLFFSRLASTIGGEHLLQHISGRWYRMADRTERYLVDEPLLMQWTAELGAQLVDPIKTTLVQNLRSMTTWILRKPQ